MSRFKSPQRFGRGMGSSTKFPRRAGFAAVVLALALSSLVVVQLTSAGAASGCSAIATTSADGSVIYGTPCPETIIATSPAVTKIFGGEGDDVIYANPDVEEVVGGGGDDVIHGELPRIESAGEVPYTPEGGVPYSPADLRPRAGVSALDIPAGGGVALVRHNPKATASNEIKECKEKVSCYGGQGNQILIGSGGDDIIFGERGDDELRGENGNDRLFGGIGDDENIKGGNGEDLLSGGYGKDFLNGEEGSDFVRGDGTIDTITDTGTSGTDTLSYATAGNPGFLGEVTYKGFPSEANSEERGVDVRLDGVTACEGIGEAAGNPYQGCDNSARYGGGNDVVNGNQFENLIGSPFDDVLIGSSANNNIYGGGGADVLLGAGGNDHLYGGAEGDWLDGGAGTDVGDGQKGANYCTDIQSPLPASCNVAGAEVHQRERGEISVGLMTTGLKWSDAYLLGSSGADSVTVTYHLVGSTGHVTFVATAGTFNITEEVKEGCATYTATEVDCALTAPLDAIDVAGFKGPDHLVLAGFEQTTSPVILGGEDSDSLYGTGGTEDVIVDGSGPGEDILSGRDKDDALVNNEGKDVLEGGQGNDLFVSLFTCEGDTIQGAESGEGKGDGEAVNNASWAPAALGEGKGGVTADLKTATAGNLYTSTPTCENGKTLDQLRNIDDLEGSNHNDALYGDENPNSIFGHKGADSLFGREAPDFIDSRDEFADKVDAGSPSPPSAEIDKCRVDGKDEKADCEKLVE
jgi:Ca2+-binding RTX toxin-like protein